MNLQKLQRVVVDALEDIKAQDVKVFNTTGTTDLFDRVVLASGNSNRQTRALAHHVREKVKEAGGHVISVEGEDTGEWVLVDLGDVVVHVMQPAIRQYYNLEEIWGGKPVRVKTAGPSLPARASEPADGEDEAPAAARPAAKRTSRKAAAGNGAATGDGSTAGDGETAAPAARKAPARKAAASKTAAAGTSAAATGAAKPRARRPAAAASGEAAGPADGAAAPASRTRTRRAAA